MSMENSQQELDEALELQARQLARALDAHANRLSMRTLKQLENGRARAVEAHTRQISVDAGVNLDGTLNQLAIWATHHRLVLSGLLLATAVCSFIVLKTLNNNESSDAFLLGAELPPEAFVDRGFEPSLNVSQSHLHQKT